MTPQVTRRHRPRPGGLSSPHASLRPPAQRLATADPRSTAAAVISRTFCKRGHAAHDFGAGLFPFAVVWSPPGCRPARSCPPLGRPGSALITGRLGCLPCGALTSEASTHARVRAAVNTGVFPSGANAQALGRGAAQRWRVWVSKKLSLSHPPAVHEGSGFSASSPALGAVTAFWPLS